MADNDQDQKDGTRGGGTAKAIARSAGRRAIGSAIGEGAGVFIALIILILFTAIIVFGGFGGGASGTNAGDQSQSQAGQEGDTATCVAKAGTCQSTCSAGYVADTSGATCTDDPSRPTCCLPLPTCEGTCVAGSRCANSTDTIDTSATSCSIGSVCCVPPSSNPTIKFYCQYNGSWNYSSCNITSYGCTPTSLAMIMSSYGSTFTPTTVSQSIRDPKYGQQIGCGGPNSKTGTSMDGARAAISWASSQGFSVAGSLANGSGRPNLSLFKKYTSTGYYIFVGAVMPFKHSSSTSATNGSLDGHSVVIYDADPNAGTVSYYDPTWCSGGRNNTPIPQTISVDAISTWYYAYPIKKK